MDDPNPRNAPLAEPLAAPVRGSMKKRVLNVGSGPPDENVRRKFRVESWSEVRLDIDPRVAPDLVGSITDMRAIVTDRCFDAVWSSHSIEHLHAGEVVPALQEFQRILKLDGFALITCPDIGAIARFIVERGLDTVAYVSPAGPITGLDMLYGHSASIAAGRTHMAHHTGLTIDLLGRLATTAGFHEARIVAGRGFDLWALLTMPEADPEAILASFEGTIVRTLFE